MLKCVSGLEEVFSVGKPSTMSVRYIGALNWRKNKEWYTYDKERKRFILTPKAPPEARRSFELFKEANHVTWDD